MELSKERINEIAYVLLMDKAMKEGIKMVPGETVRGTKNLSLKLGIPVEELAYFFRTVIDCVYKETDRKLRSIKPSDKVEERSSS